ncbi:dihydroxyacetone phosphate acyltransferase-like [Amphiura filiformis]|uniref:dihydroxyacetone phosphate acyltransferase-like n=1 Tax=Amphiura filiformis TaxID=82378 RepID=UPI003B224CC8
MEGYDDILAPRRQGLDISFALQKKEDLPEYKYVHHQLPKQFKEEVLKSQRLRHTIDQVSSESGRSKEELMEEAKQIVEEMGHAFTMKNIRVLGYLFPKVYRRLYDHIYINREGIDKLHNCMKETPVILLPSHRSYIDFLLMSYIMYHYDLPMPYIAAGADFMAMKFVGTILRKAGAFFMRRSFGSDQLYWSIFTEYVQGMIISGQSPIEFFLEGTRSRTGKFLPPKLGLLRVVVEPFLNGKLWDVNLVPVSMTYDRTLEELLYSREMLGIPKPKESTSGLIKARSILNDNYGNITVHFGEPISLRKLSTGRLDRSIHNLKPRFIFSLSDEEQEFVRDMAYTTQLQQIKYMVVSPWILCASLIMQKTQQGISFDELCKDAEWLKGVVVSIGAHVYWPTGRSVQSIIKSALQVHHPIARVTKQKQVVLSLPSNPLGNTEATTQMRSKAEVMEDATIYLALASYRNQLIPPIIQAAVVATAFGGFGKTSRDDLFSNYQFLVKLLSFEFTFHPATTKEDFRIMLRKFETNFIVTGSDAAIEITQQGRSTMSFLAQVLQPFLLGYWFVCHYLMNVPDVMEPLTRARLGKDIQSAVVGCIADGDLFEYDLLSLNLLGNAINAVVEFRGLNRVRSTIPSITPNNGNGTHKEVLGLDQKEVGRIAARIGEFVQLPVKLLSRPLMIEKARQTAKL